MAKLKPIKLRVKKAETTIRAEIDPGRINQNLDRAQFKLDSAVMTSMVPYMPMISGSFINLTRARSEAMAGTGKVVAAAPPFGRYLYFGKVMVDESTGSTYARKGAKKVLVSQYAGKTNASEDIEFSKTKHPDAQKEWFKPAKAADLESWIRVAKGEMKHGE